MKKLLIRIGIGILLFLFCVYAGLNIWIGVEMQHNINRARQKYPGTAEDALIAFLEDENNSPNDRTHLAIWTLGQLQSKKALPVLYKYYKNDPQGMTCHGRHNSVLCQYAINTAITTIKSKWIIPFIVPGKQ